jgi:exosortase A-associated hydrolase 1
MRRMTNFACEGVQLAATLDEGTNGKGLLIISGGNEIRSGAHSGQAAMAAHFAKAGYPVFRYDRRGTGESEGDNGGFLSSHADLAAAVSAFRAEAPHLVRILAFGNCDAASALALFHDGLGLDGLVLANPWVIEAADDTDEAHAMPPAAAIRARYLDRLKNPRTLLDLLSGKIDLRKLWRGLSKAAAPAQSTGPASQIAAALNATSVPTTILLAERDATALAFLAEWRKPLFALARARSDLIVAHCTSASHSFADSDARAWLYSAITRALES